VIFMGRVADLLPYPKYEHWSLSLEYCKCTVSQEDISPTLLLSVVYRDGSPGAS